MRERHIDVFVITQPGVMQKRVVPYPAPQRLALPIPQPFSLIDGLGTIESLISSVHLGLHKCGNEYIHDLVYWPISWSDEWGLVEYDKLRWDYIL